MNLKITEDTEEILALGRRFASEHPEYYPESMLCGLWAKYREFIPDKAQFDSMLYSAVYCQQVYGTSFTEYLIYDFRHRTHEEKMQYLTWYNRYIYLAFLNREKDPHCLDNKFEAYTLLKPFYKRDAMLLSDESDFPAFRDFVSKHGAIFVKPVNLELAEGVHRLAVREDADLRAVFRSLLDEAKLLDSSNVIRPIDRRLILEEEIIPSAEISRFNPAEMSLLRVITIQVRGRIHFFYPCFRLMYGDGRERCGENYSMDALIDAETGIVTTDGMTGLEEFEFHPVSGLKIKGFAMPEWDALKEMLTEAARKFPSIRYIGWDVVHTDRGWCIIEGNTNGEFFMQLCAGHGLREELESLIGFRIPADRLPDMTQRLFQTIHSRLEARKER